jgi:hypothetical protein
MSDEIVGNVGVFTRIEQRLDRIEDKLDSRMNTLDAKVDGLAARQDRQEGRLDGIVSVIKWLGPVGVAAILFGLLAIYGLLPVGAGS